MSERVRERATSVSPRRPPLDVIGLFAAAPGELPAAPAGLLPCAVEPCPALPDILDVHLRDPEQPLGLGERGPLALARCGLRLRWDADVPPGERLPSAVERMAALLDGGALGVYLPAACKVIGAAELAARLATLDRDETWWDLFVQSYAVLADVGVWLHTHGLEHFGYPDLECWTPADAIAPAEHLLATAVEHLMRHGGTALWPGQIVEAVAGHEVWTRFSVREAPAVAGHAYGAYGALELVLP
jgi:hypothetical protein